MVKCNVWLRVVFNINGFPSLSEWYSLVFDQNSVEYFASAKTWRQQKRRRGNESNSKTIFARASPDSSRNLYASTQIFAFFGMKTYFSQKLRKSRIDQCHAYYLQTLGELKVVTRIEKSPALFFVFAWWSSIFIRKHYELKPLFSILRSNKRSWNGDTTCQKKVKGCKSCFSSCKMSFRRVTEGEG